LPGAPSPPTFRAQTMLLEMDRAVVERFAARVRDIAPDASIWVFGSRARGEAAPDSDLDMCVELANASSELRESIRSIAWEVGFEHDRVITTVVFSRSNFDFGPISASTLVANIRREGVAA
jgi:uncharacterized protein